MLQGVIPLIFIALIDPRLLLSPLAFAVGVRLALRHYTRRLNPVSVRDARAVRQPQRRTQRSGPRHRGRQGDRAGSAGAGAVRDQARAYRDSFVEQGVVQARYLPPLLLAVATAGGLLHGLLLYRAGELSLGDLVAFLGLMGLLGFPAMISIFTFSLVQLGIASARRILALMREETELDQNAAGHRSHDAGRDRLRARHLRLRRRAGASQAVVPGRAGTDGRDRRRDRLGQEHDDQARQPHLRRRRGPRS